MSRRIAARPLDSKYFQRIIAQGPRACVCNACHKPFD